ncbi:hypothetical protein GGF39_001801 [Coemansia sp. RSA 1721]|nr:hypothetical protein GGF39_001801 [Coemansia sp. RSA 1721]
MASSTVRVALRIRPLSPQEHINGETECVTQLPGVPQVVIGADRAFTFDYVFSPEVSQEQVYDESIKPLVAQFLQGYNATVLAYGPEAAKHSAWAPACVVPRAIHEIWNHLDERAKKHSGFTFSVDISFLELYNEDLVDLLNPKSLAGPRGSGPTIREDSRGNMVLVGVERKPATNASDIIGFLHQGALSRTTASTDMNHTSSRSHAIFTIFLRQQDRRSSSLASPGALSENAVLDTGPSIVSKIHFVDLAGSERIKRTGAAGDRAREGISINAGLLALGNVISALGSSTSPSNNAQPKRTPHVPYRDSKLTRLLQDSLGGNSQTLMLACISPSDKNNAESLNTIRYANRARNIRNKVAVNFDKNSSVELNMLKTEVARLRGELSKLKVLRRQSTLSLLDSSADPESSKTMETEMHSIQLKNAELVRQLDQAVRRVAELEHERDLLRARVQDLGGSAQNTPDIPAAVLDEAAEHVSRINGSIKAFSDNDMMSQNNVLNTLDRELSDQAERHENQIASVRRHYESKIELLHETLSIVQKERDVALQRLANSANSAAKPLTAASLGALGRSQPSASSRHNLGLDTGSNTGSAPTAPTKLRLPSRVASKSVPSDVSSPNTSVSCKSSNAELRNAGRGPQAARRGSNAASTNSSSLRDNTLQMRKLQEQIAILQQESNEASKAASVETERLTIQIQEQAKEISRLRKQRTGRRESHRYSLLSFKENSSWAVAKSTQGEASDKESDNSPSLLRAAFIKTVLEDELHRCVRARQLLRERDSYVNKQDELMTEQTDLMLSIQTMELESDDGFRHSQVQRLNDRIEIIDAELRYLDLKVRDAEAEVAQLAEATANDSSKDLSASGLMSTPMIINMSGLAMRMDIIEHRLVGLRDEQTRAKLEEQIMDLRRTLLAMQKTALNAALSYERELGHAERKLSTLTSPSASSIKLNEASDIVGMANPASLLNGSNHSGSSDAHDDYQESIAASSGTSSALNSLVERSVYDGIRDRGILLRSALMSSIDDSSHTDSRYDNVSASYRHEYLFDQNQTGHIRDGDNSEAICESAVFNYDSQLLSNHTENTSSMDDIRGAKAVIGDLDDDMADFTNESLFRAGTLQGRKSRKWLDDSGLNSESLILRVTSNLSSLDHNYNSSADFAASSVDSSDEHDSTASYSNMRRFGVYSASQQQQQQQQQRDVPDDRSLLSSPHLSAIVEQPVPVLASAMDYSAKEGLPNEQIVARVSTPTETSYSGGANSSPIESENSFSDNMQMQTPLKASIAHVDSALPSNSSASGFDVRENSEYSESEVPELYDVASRDFFRLPNLVRNQSIRGQGRRKKHLVRRSSARKKIARGLAPAPRVARKPSNKRRISIRKAKISLPIVPQDMIDFIQRRNPTAIDVGQGPPAIASPELLCRMRASSNADCQGMSPSGKKKRLPNVLPTPQATPQIFVPQVADSMHSQVSVGNSGGSDDSEALFVDAVDGFDQAPVSSTNTPSPAPTAVASAIVCSPICAPRSSTAVFAGIHGTPASPFRMTDNHRLSAGNQIGISLTDKGVQETYDLSQITHPLHSIGATPSTTPTTVVIPGIYSSGIPGGLVMHRPVSALSVEDNYTKERACSRIGTPSYRYNDGSRSLSPVDNATSTSLCLTVDTETPNAKTVMAPRVSIAPDKVLSPYSDEYQSEINRPAQHGDRLGGKAMSSDGLREQADARGPMFGGKLSRIRRRAHTELDSNQDASSSKNSNRQSILADSDKAAASSPSNSGIRRLSKILSGIGFGGGGKAKHAVFSKPNSTTENVTSRDRSNSDSVAMRKKNMRKVYSNIDGPLFYPDGGLQAPDPIGSNDRPASSYADGYGFNQHMYSRRPSTANPGELPASAANNGNGVHSKLVFSQMTNSFDY